MYVRYVYSIRLHWDEILMILKEHFRKHFQDLESICPDPMMITHIPELRPTQ